MTSLIEKGWDPQLKDEDGATPADYSQHCRGEHSGCQEVLAILGKPTPVSGVGLYYILQSTSLLKSMVPNKVSPNAMFVRQNMYVPLLSSAIRFLGCTPDCTPQDLAGIKHLLDEGANPNRTRSERVRKK